MQLQLFNLPVNRSTAQRKRSFMLRCLIPTIILVILSALLSCFITVYVTVAPEYLRDIKLLVPEEGGVIPLDLNSKWLESLEVTFNIAFCSGNVTVIGGTSCSSLAKTRFNSSNEVTSSHFYALPGSRIDIHLSEDIVSENNDLVHVWITPDLETRKRLVLQTDEDSTSHDFDCADHDDNLQDPLVCFPVRNETDIHYEITRGGYYFFLLTNSDDTIGIYKNPLHVHWYYSYVTFDLDATWKIHPENSSYSIPHTSTDANGIHVKVNHTEVQIPHAFADLITESCTLLQLTCPNSGGASSVAVTNLKFRRDLLGLMFIVYIAIVFLIAAILTVLFCLFHKKSS